MMKTIAFLLICILGWFKPSTPFEILSAEHQVSVGGRRESGITSAHVFKIVAKQSSEKLQFNDLWIDSVYYKISPYKQNADLSFSQTWEKGDTIFIRTSKRTFPDDGKFIKDFNGENKPLPMSYEGAALIGYKHKGKQRYHIVNQITQLPKEYHP